MSNLIHKRGSDNSFVVGKARKMAKIESGYDIVHPYKQIKDKKNIFDEDSSLQLCMSYLLHIGKKIAL